MLCHFYSLVKLTFETKFISAGNLLKMLCLQHNQKAKCTDLINYTQYLYNCEQWTVMSNDVCKQLKIIVIKV